MPMTTDPYWIERVRSIKANNPSWGGGRITRALQQEASESDREGPVPSEATVRRILRRYWDQMSEVDQNQYLYFYWPESMERGDLPWEASAAAIELLRYYPIHMENTAADTTARVNKRPSIRLVKWFWRVTQAMPSPPRDTPPEARRLHADIRTALAANLHLREWPKESMPVRQEQMARDAERALVQESINEETIRAYILSSFDNIGQARPQDLPEEEAHNVER